MGVQENYCFNFLDFNTELNPNPEMYMEYFINYDSAQWKRGSGGGSFKYFDGIGIEYSLTILEDSRFGIMLSYEKWNDKDNKCIGTWYSIGKENELDNIIENEDEFEVPLGAYLKPENAWLAVKAYILNPHVIPQEIKWIDVNDIRWME